MHGASGLLPGTPKMLILQILRSDALHGYAIAQRLKDVSRDVLQVGEISENNRRDRYYSLTPASRKQLAAEREEFDRSVAANPRVLQIP